MRKSNKDNLTERDIIKRQFLSFQQLDSNVDVINIVSNYTENQNEIGNNTDHFNYSNYKELSQTILKEEGFSISLIDDSFLNLYYVFDENGNIEKHVLSFVPSYKNDLYRDDAYLQQQPEEDYDNDANITIEQFGKRVSNYIRVDYDMIGQKKYYHTPVHMHIGVFDYSVRFPLEYALYPYDFLYLIFKYIYHYSEEALSVLEDTASHRIQLDEDEMRRFKIVYQRNDKL